MEVDGRWLIGSKGRLSGRRLARYHLRGPSPAAPFQTVRADFPHTACRWSSRRSFMRPSRSALSRTTDAGPAPETTPAASS